MQGRIKLHRKAQSNPIASSLELFGLFSFFLLKANHSAWSFFLWQQKIDLLPWQFIWSMQWIADHFSISKPKAYRLTELLEKSEIVKRKWYSKYTLFTIVNRWSYQWEWNAIVTTSDTQPYTNNNDKNKKDWKEILSKDNTANAEYGNKEINNLITLLKDKCSQQWIIYSADPSERNYAKHLLSKKFSANLIEFWMSMEEFVWNIVKLSTQPYTKQVNNCKKFYYNRWDVINQSKNNMKKEPQTKIFTV